MITQKVIIWFDFLIWNAQKNPSGKHLLPPTLTSILEVNSDVPRNFFQKASKIVKEQFTTTLSCGYVVSNGWDSLISTFFNIEKE